MLTRKKFLMTRVLFSLIVFLLINVVTTINYASRQDDLPKNVTQADARTTSQILEASTNINKLKKSYSLQEGTEHLLQFGALLRTKILDTFGYLVYDRYDDFSISQVEALYKVYHETLERKYNIFDIVTSFFKSADIRPTKVCQSINENVHTCLKESSQLCMSIKKHNKRRLINLNQTPKIYQLAKIQQHFPEGFSVKIILKHLQNNTLKFTPSLLSGLLHNIQYDSFDDEVRTAERELILFLTKSSKISKDSILMTSDEIQNKTTISGLLRWYLKNASAEFKGPAKFHADILAEHVVREVEAISQNIELLGTIYENNSINLKYLFDLILPPDVLDKDLSEAKEYLLGKIDELRVISKYLRVEKYQQAGPDQLLMEILGQMRDIHFAVDIVSALHTHARFWHRSRAIESLNELLELFSSYENLRKVEEYEEMMKTIDQIKDRLWDSKNVTIEIYCSNPRACLQIGLQIVMKCNFIDQGTKNLIKKFNDKVTIKGSPAEEECPVREILPVESDAETTEVKPEIEEFSDTTEEPKTEYPPNIKKIFSEAENKTTILFDTAEPSSEIPALITTIVLEETGTEYISTKPKDDDTTTEKVITESKMNTEPEIVTESEVPTGTPTIEEIKSISKTTENLTTTTTPELTTIVDSAECSGSEECSSKCSDKDCSSKADCSTEDCTSEKSCSGEDCESEKCEGLECPVPDDKKTDCEGENCIDEKEKGDCEGKDCPDTTEKNYCEGEDCPDTIEKNDCEGEDCPEEGKEDDCEGTDCPDKEGTVDCEGPNCPEKEGTLDCEGPDCPNEKGTTDCEGSDCPATEETDCTNEETDCSDEENATVCSGSDCPIEEGKTDCEGSECPDKRDDDCGGTDCPETGKNDCEGSGCPIEESKTDCKDSNCPEEKKEAPCEGSECPEADCKGKNCPPDSENKCPGEECSDEFTNKTVFCDNKDPHRQRKKERLQKMRQFDLLPLATFKYEEEDSEDTPSEDYSSSDEVKAIGLDEVHTTVTAEIQTDKGSAESETEFQEIGSQAEEEKLSRKHHSSESKKHTNYHENEGKGRKEKIRQKMKKSNKNNNSRENVTPDNLIVDNKTKRIKEKENLKKFSKKEHSRVTESNSDLGEFSSPNMEPEKKKRKRTRPSKEIDLVTESNGDNRGELPIGYLESDKKKKRRGSSKNANLALSGSNQDYDILGTSSNDSNVGKKKHSKQKDKQMDRKIIPEDLISKKEKKKMEKSKKKLAKQKNRRKDLLEDKDVFKNDDQLKNDNLSINEDSLKNEDLPKNPSQKKQSINSYRRSNTNFPLDLDDVPLIYQTQKPTLKTVERSYFDDLLNTDDNARPENRIFADNAYDAQDEIDKNREILYPKRQEPISQEDMLDDNEYYEDINDSSDSKSEWLSWLQ